MKFFSAGLIGPMGNEGRASRAAIKHLFAAKRGMPLPSAYSLYDYPDPQDDLGAASTRTFRPARTQAGERFRQSGSPSPTHGCRNHMGIDSPLGWIDHPEWFLSHGTTTRPYPAYRLSMDRIFRATAGGRDQRSKIIITSNRDAAVVFFAGRRTSGTGDTRLRLSRQTMEPVFPWNDDTAQLVLSESRGAGAVRQVDPDQSCTWRVFFPIIRFDAADGIDAGESGTSSGPVGIRLARVPAAQFPSRAEVQHADGRSSNARASLWEFLGREGVRGWIGVATEGCRGTLLLAEAFLG